MTKKYPIEQPEQCLRLDIFLRELDARFSRQLAREAIAEGEVLVSGRRAKPGYALQVGDTVEILSEPVAITARPELAHARGVTVSSDVISSLNPPQLKILREDSEIVVLYKPRGMHSVVLTVEDELTVADCLAGWRQDQLDVSPDPREAGLVQRLDRFTEGVMLAAKSAETWQTLHHGLVHGQSKKHYMALVEGVVREKRKVVSGLADTSKKRVSFPASRGELTESVVTVKWHDPKRKISLVEIELLHAVRHQIRAHLAGAGHPLVGDVQYGASRQLIEIGVEEADGFYLLAQSVQFCHPTTGEMVKIHCEAAWINSIQR